ncbi:MAG TPA: DNA polymerase II small subunit, partial [Methanomicrobiales archaeon]|nr:DNA polymerase II small subunit [Methanomicrobiales archaeon]
MLDDQEIVQRFLDTKLQVHPDVVSYIRKQGDPALIDRIIAGIPESTVVVSSQHIPGLTTVRDGMRFLTDPQVEVIRGSADSSGSASNFEDFVHLFRDRYTRLGNIIRGRNPAMPIEALSRTSRYNQQECTVIGMVGEVRTTASGNRLTDVEDPTGQISVLFNKDRPVFKDAERLLPDEVIGVRGKLSQDG